MKAKSNQSRQAAFKARMRESGFEQITVWIPSDKKADVLAYIKGLRK